MAILSQRLNDLRASPVRAMLKTSMQSDMISFAGGLPSEDSFATLTPLQNIQNVMQYGPSEGEFELRELIAQDLKALGLDCDSDRVLILSGSQQGIDLTVKLVVDAETRIALETPTYLAALQVFRFFGAKFESLDPSEPGQDWTCQSHPSLAYIIPTFQNPSGRCWTNTQRQAFAQKCEDMDVVLFEDDPYRDLAYDNCDRRPVASMMRSGSWIYQGSFSKTLAPGLRLGFMSASADLFPHLVLLKQAADLHTNRISQHMVIDFLKTANREQRRHQLIINYKKKRDEFASQMARHFGKNASWEIPAGGLFFWVNLPDLIDVELLFKTSISRNVLFTPGHHFYAGNHPYKKAMRLNFSHTSKEKAEIGLAILAELIRKQLA